MNTPNKLTVIRVILVPFFVAALMWQGLPHHYILAMALFGIAAYTDFLDGKIARRDHLITDFGKFMDPLADKILVMSALICFAALGHTTVWMVILIMFREFAVTSVRLVAAGSGKVIAANNLGKIKTVTQMIAILVVMLLQYLLELGRLHILPLRTEFTVPFHLLGELFMAVATFFALYSGYVYLKENWDAIKQIK